MDVSIVIVSYNTKELLRNCLESVFKHVIDVEFDVYVVDNNSQDGSCEMVRESFPQVKLIINDENKGFGAANNIAIRDSKAEYVFLLNSDTVIRNNCLKYFLEFMQKPENSQVAVCGGKLLNPDGSYQNSWGFERNFTNTVLATMFFMREVNPFYKGVLQGLTAKKKGVPEKIAEVGWINGADMFIRKSVLEEIGLFDEDFFLFFEEIELSHRIRKAGYSSMIVPQAEIVHFGGQSEKNSLKKIKEYIKSEIRYYEKTLGKNTAILAKSLIILRYLYFVEFNADYFRRIALATKVCVEN